ncbi:MAG: hypothetical protein NTW00_17350 [Hyphomicrobiales bacterium]|nr:hypothetical protein [Hyphomicrobiales bacterium]
MTAPVSCKRHRYPPEIIESSSDGVDGSPRRHCPHRSMIVRIKDLTANGFGT